MENDYFGSRVSFHFRTIASRLAASFSLGLLRAREVSWAQGDRVSFLPASAQNNGISIGYGFSFLTRNEDKGEVQQDRNYNFEHLTYFHQWPLFRNGYVALEPFLAYVNRPESGWEFGASLLFRYDLKTSDQTSLFFNLEGGGAPSTVDFEEQQGNHNFFILAGGIGFKWGNYFIENRFRHYSNGGLSIPYGSVNANIIMIGLYF